MCQLPTVVERTEEGIRVESGFRWPDESATFTPRPTLLEIVVDLLSTLSAAALLIALGFVAGAMWGSL